MNDIPRFFLALGQVLGGIIRSDTRTWLNRHGVPEYEIKAFEAAASRIAEAAYLDEVKSLQHPKGETK